MTQACFFHFEGYYCDTTEAEECYEVLEDKFRSHLTLPQHKKLVPACAQKIEEKTSNRFAQKARGIYNEFYSKKEEGTKKVELVFYEHLPQLEIKCWESFIKENQHELEPFRLIFFLRDKWNEKKNRFKDMNEPEEQAVVKTVDKIMSLILNAFGKKKDKLEISMEMLKNEVQNKLKEYKIKELTGKIRTLHEEKKWQELADYLKPIEWHEYSGQFIRFLEEMTTVAGMGVQWLESKSKLQDAALNRNSIDLEALLNELSRMKQEIEYIFSGQEQYGKKGEENELTRIVTDTCECILDIIRSSNHTEIQYKQLIESEKKLETMFPFIPETWGVYKDTINSELYEVYMANLEEILKNNDRLEDVGKGVESIKEKARETGNDEITEQVEKIGEMWRKLSSYSNWLENFLSYDDPLLYKFKKRELAELKAGFEELADAASGWIAFNRLKERFETGTTLMHETMKIVNAIDSLIGELKEESQKILCKNLVVNLQDIRKKINHVEKDLHKLQKANDSFRSFEILETITQDIKKIIYPRAYPKPCSGTENNITRTVTALVEEGHRLGLKFEKILAEQEADPIRLIDELFALIEDYKGKDFILTEKNEEQIRATIEKLSETIEIRIKESLLPVQTAVTPFIPLVPTANLQEYKERLTRQKELMSGSREYNGFEELTMPFEEELEELSVMVRMQLDIHQSKLEDAAKYIETRINLKDSFRSRMQMFIYYYGNLRGLPWDDSRWFVFFERFGYQLSAGNKNNERKNKPMLEAYETDFTENLLLVSPGDLDKHYKLFEKFMSENPIVYHAGFLTENRDSNSLIEKINLEPLTTKILPLFVEYMKANEIWPKYDELFRAENGRLQEYFGSEPLGTVRESLDKQIAGLEMMLPEGTVTDVELKTVREKIPTADDYSLQQDRYQVVEDLFHNLEEINRTFKQIEIRDIWCENNFKALLGDMARKGDRFSGAFAAIRRKNGWEEMSRHLRKIYDRGRLIMKKFQVNKEIDVLSDIAVLENHNSKASEEYSERLEKFLSEALGLWKEFNDEIETLQPRYDTLKAVYNDRYFNAFLGRWQRTGCWRLWHQQHFQVPGNMEGFFKMLNETLDNHRRFRENIDNGGKPAELDVSRTDPFIDTRVIKAKQEGK
ncbi:MAG: hypothetical protein GY757_04300 [bacterium]|nr:hypothetical protein [bacterium]